MVGLFKLNNGHKVFHILPILPAVMRQSLAQFTSGSFLKQLSQISMHSSVGSKIGVAIIKFNVKDKIIIKLLQTQSENE